MPKRKRRKLRSPTFLSNSRLFMKGEFVYRLRLACLHVWAGSSFLNIIPNGADKSAHRCRFIIQTKLLKLKWGEYFCRLSPMSVGDSPSRRFNFIFPFMLEMKTKTKLLLKLLENKGKTRWQIVKSHDACKKSVADGFAFVSKKLQAERNEAKQRNSHTCLIFRMHLDVDRNCFIVLITGFSLLFHLEKIYSINLRKTIEKFCAECNGAPNFVFLNILCFLDAFMEMKK